ncbi:MAG: hypothetical protein CVU39_20095 [Chloroflexi bacterium HGW-Chloroflexi-10]|nr:MAG: hypothetical protein CVU39_20095 [Chloroflexi bacterium HGW-Chloroflexi-10]
MPPFNIPIQYRQQYLNRIEMAMTFIDHNLTSDLDLASVAQAANFSPYHFHRIFSALTGETPQDYISRLRVERAANMLVKSPALSITEIAFACGYSSSSVFSRSFKKTFGVPASRYARTAPAELSGERKAVNPHLPRQDNFVLPEIRIIRAAPLHLAYFSARKGYSEASTKAVWQKLFQWAQARQLLTPATQLVAISFDDPEITPRNKCRYYACIPVPADLPLNSGAGFFDYPEHLCAVCRLRCDVAEFPAAYRAFYRNWLPDSGFIMADFPPYEVYYDAPDINPGSKYEFDLCVPISLF